LEEKMNYKEYIFIIGISVTLVLGIGNIIFNFITSRKRSFINTVTSERIKWIANLRKDISNFCGLTLHYSLKSIDNSNKEQEVIEEIDRLRYKIKLQLNPNEEESISIIKLIDEIPSLTDRLTIDKLINDELRIKLDILTSNTQVLLKKEWDKVKAESKKGDLRKKGIFIRVFYKLTKIIAKK